MSMLSVFAGVCGFFASAMIGLWLKKRLLRKAKFYENYYEYLTFATEKIAYERMPIGELNATFSLKYKGEFSDFLKGKAGGMPLGEGESSEIRDYLSGIGTTDAETQIASLKGKCAELKRFTENDCAKYRKDGSLYFKLSALLGLVIFILLV